MLVFITDLDGTLLDGDYSCKAAVPALVLLEELGVPLVLCTSKTRSEVEAVRRRLGNRDPFIVENGGALYIPEGYFPVEIQTPVRRGGYAVIEFGSRYPELVESLRLAADESRCAVKGFHQMSAEEVALCCNMPPEIARLAKQREYDEPFEILDGDAPSLLSAIERQKKRWTRGGRFYHVLGANDKAHCVNLLIHYYRRAFGRITTVGLGDGLNDAGFLRLVDEALLLESRVSGQLASAVPRGRLCSGGGPEAWNAAVLDTVLRRLRDERRYGDSAAPPRFEFHAGGR
jgi:mannosyl-3-phosphoglycerate phosphatase